MIFICIDKTKLEEVFLSVPKNTKYLMEYQSQHDQGCIIKKVKLNKENTNFILTDFTTITKSKLPYHKAEHQVILYHWPAKSIVLQSIYIFKLFQNINFL